MREAELILRLMKREGLDQAALAAAAGVSQPTVSRALTTEPVRRGRAYRKLLAYVTGRSGKKPLATSGTKRVAKAFEKIWDGSDVHAAIVAQIIKDLAGLAPSRELRKRFGDRKRT